ILGTSGDDHLVISQTANEQIVVRDMKRGVDLVSYPAPQVHTIRVLAGDGNDVVDLRGLYRQQVTKVGDLRGGKGNDSLFLGNARGTLQGEDGNDQLYGSKALDQLFGGLGDDFLYGGADNDLVDGGAGNDWLFGESGDDQLLGAAGADKLFGGLGADVLKGGDGDDFLSGGDGDDYLNGELGKDVAQGGAGVDTIRRQLHLATGGLSLSSQDSTKTNDGKIEVYDNRGNPVDPQHLYYDEKEKQFYHYDKGERVYVYADDSESENQPATPPEEVTGTFLTAIRQTSSDTCAILAVLGAVGSQEDFGGKIKYDAQTDRYGVTMYEEIPVYLGMDLQPMAKAHTIWVTGDWTEGRDPSGSMVAVLYQKAYLEFMNIRSRGQHGELLDKSRWEVPVNSDWQSIGRAFFSVTGKSPTWVAAGTAAGTADAARMQRHFQASGTMVAASQSGGVTSGVVPNHCYTVVGVYRKLSTWYVRLYNPWGADGNTGALFDQTSGGGTVNKDDGFLSLTWDQFAANFQGYTFLS
ncbi:MAG: hypothetical protein AB7F89_16095, partial [Pirellulaceae bacterium]